MTIVVVGGKYFIPYENGFREIPKSEVMDAYEKGFITESEVISYEYD